METAFHPGGCDEAWPRQHLPCVLGWRKSELLDHLCGDALHLHHAVNLDEYYTACEEYVGRTQTAIQYNSAHHRLRTSLATYPSRDKSAYRMTGCFRRRRRYTASLACSTTAWGSIPERRDPRWPDY